MKIKPSVLKIAIWAFALVVFYLTIGQIVAFIVLEQIAKAINAHASFLGEWYQILMFVIDIFCLVGLIGSVVLFVLASKKHIGEGKKKNSFLKSFFDRTVWGGISAFMAVLTAIIFVGTGVCQKYSGNINDALKIETMKQINVDDDGEVPIYVPSDYYNEDGSYNDKAMRANSWKVAEEAASESTVVLWNNDNALPLAQNSKIGIFGMAQLKNKFFYTGTGSGYLNPTNGIEKSLSQELRDQNLQVYRNLELAYQYSAKYGMKQISNKQLGIRDINYQEARINDVPWADINATKQGNVTERYSEYEDAAIYIIQRYGGETLDLNFKDDDNELIWGDDCVDGNYLDLSANEMSVLENLTNAKKANKIKKVILLINSANAVQFKTIRNYDIDACLWIGMGGGAAFKQIANALTGKINPSGKLVDTFVYDNYSAPAMENFGDFTFEGQDGDNPSHDYTWNTKYVAYQEGIYLGYRYYETRYEDSVLKRGNANGTAGVKAGNGNWMYTDEVAYTFGYGLSYTTFEYSDYKVNKKGEDYEISVTVKNTGGKEGKEAVQIYLQKPYTEYDKQNKIEKSSVELVGFAKTKTLTPGDRDILKITVKAEEFKTYDSYGKKTYILEAGDYYLAAGRNAHDALNNILAKKGKTTADGMDYNGSDKLVQKIVVGADDYEKYSKTSATGYKVTNLFDDADINLYEGTSQQKIIYLSRNDWQGTYPKPVLMKLSSKIKEDMAYGVEPEVRAGDEMPSYGKTSEKYGHINLVSMMEVDYYDTEKWDAFMDQTTWEEQVILVTTGSHRIKGIASVGAPEGLNHNGPSGLNQPNPKLGSVMAFPSEVNLAQTFNTELVYKVGDAFGMEMMHAKHTSLNGLGADLHRTAYSGRNWEYYSEDAFMTGAMLSAQSEGLQHRGIILFTKHFIMNDQERNRYGTTTWANEQTIRELHAKGIEMAVTGMNLNGIMSSFNRVGCVWSGRHEGLLTTLLRKEWGFTGAIETDAAVGIHMTDEKAMANAIVAGQDLWLMGGKLTAFDSYKNNPTVALAVREAARRIMYAELHANVMNGVKTTTTFIRVTPWWENALEVLKIVSASILALCLCYFALSFFVQSKLFSNESAEAVLPGEIVNAEGTNGNTQKTAGMSVCGVRKFVENNSKILTSVTAGIVAIAVIFISVFGSVGVYAPKSDADTSASASTGGGSSSGITDEEHVCNVCPVCGGCLNDECEEEVCKTKCGSIRKHIYAFEAENDKTVLTAGTRGQLRRIALDTGKTDLATQKPVGCIGEFSQNGGASIKYYLASSKKQTATLKLRISATTPMTVTDVIAISVNDVILDRKTQVEVKVVDGNPSWWYFVEANLGCIELEEGENFIELTSLSQNGNIDKIEIFADEEITWNDGTKADVVDGVTTPVEEEKLPDINVENDDSACTKTNILYAVENVNAFASFVTVKADKTLSTPENRKNNEGKIPVGNLNQNKGATVTFSVIASGIGEVGLYSEFCNRKLDLKFDDWATLVVNGEKYTSTAVMPKDEEWTPSNTFVRLGFINLKEGENEISIVVKGDVGVNVYGLKFTSEVVDVTPNEMNEKVENINVTFDDSSWNEYVFYALTQSGELETNVEKSELVNIRTDKDKINTAGVGCLGNIDTGKGRTITFYVNALSSGKVGLYMELGNLKDENKLSDWADITINDKKYSSNAVMPTGTNYTPSNRFVKVGLIELKKGLNVITFTINNTAPLTGHNFYGLKFTSESVSIEKGSKA